MKKLMLVAGGIWQCAIAKKAKEMGYYLICSNLYKNSPAFRWADVSVVANVLDYEANFKIANKYTPDAIITDQSDIAVRTVAKLNETLKLPGIGSDIANRFSNKHLMRQFCKNNNLPCPAFHLCFNVDEAVDFFRYHGKSVIKPLDSQASRGIFIVETEKELRNFFAASLECSICQKAVLIEEFIGGTEFTVDAIKTQCGVTTLAISEKKHYDKYPSVASMLLFTKKHLRFDYDLLRKINSQLIVKMGLPFGLTHAEYKFDKGKFYLIEIAARGGGSNISATIAPYMSGIDSNAALIKMALGETVDRLEAKTIPSRCSCLEFFDFPSGIANNIIGNDFLNKNPNILESHFNFAPGENVPLPSDDSKRPGHYIAAANNISELDKIRQEVKSNVFIQYK